MTAVALALFLLCALMLVACFALLIKVDRINADSKRNLNRAELYYWAASGLGGRVSKPGEMTAGGLS